MTDTHDNRFLTPEFGPLTNPEIAAFLDEDPQLVRSLTRCSLEYLVAVVGAMWTMPEFQASAVRLEALQHLAVLKATGTLRPRARSLKKWLDRLGENQAGRLEDPAEDVFVSRILGPDGDYLIFEGNYETAAFYLQRFVNVVDDMPKKEPFSSIHNSVRALLSLSNEVASRSSVHAFTVGTTEPLQDVTPQLVNAAIETRVRVRFSHADLDRLGIARSDLEPFVFDLDKRSTLSGEGLWCSALERFPILDFGEYLYLALPAAISMAIRRFIIEFCRSAGIEPQLYSTYVQELLRTFEQMPMLDAGVMPSLPRQKKDGVIFSNAGTSIDEGRVLHLCFVFDNFENYERTGSASPNPNTDPVCQIIDKSIRQFYESTSSQPKFREGITIVVPCSWGRPIAYDFEHIRDPRWRIDTIPVPDLEVLSWAPSFSVRVLWSLLDSVDRLSTMDVSLLNVNGLLNLYAWSESLSGHLVPHGQLPDDFTGGPLTIVVEQNSLLELRRRSAQAADVHRAQTWDGRTVKVRRYRQESLFDEDEDKPLYASLDDLENGQLVGVYETPYRGWWLMIETPNSEDRSFHYQLWQALLMWLERAADLLDGAVDGLPNGPICWSCRFQDNETISTDAALPTIEEARSLLTLSIQNNVIQLVANHGFINSFRHAKNIGERLLVESFVTGTLHYAQGSADAQEVQQLTEQIVPDEWARDVHLFSAQQFRDFFRSGVVQSPILISKIDDAYLRLGLGWRVRKRADGPRVSGISNCCAYLNSVVESIYHATKEELTKYDREKLLQRLLANHEALEHESDRWLRTARAILSLHRDKTTAEETSAGQIAKLNSSSLATRLIIEMAVCESPVGRGRDPGPIDISRLLASSMQMYSLGGWSDAIRYEGKAPEIRITPLGDIHTQVEFDQQILEPYGRAIGVARYRGGAGSYEEYFDDVTPVESTQEHIEPAFWDAWIEAFGFTIDELRIFIDNLENYGIHRQERVFTARDSDLYALEDPSRLPQDSVKRILEVFCLKPRESWDATPEGFRDKDWHPWRFRRRLSLISKPIVQLNSYGEPRYIVAPGVVRAGAIKVIEYCHRGGYEAKDFPEGKMRSWIGLAENLRGHEFNGQVAERLRTIGWGARSDVKMSEILHGKWARQYGDIDVLAWKGEQAVALECKDLEMAMTTGEIARQLYDFRGEHRADGKPDRLKRHLMRVALLREYSHKVSRFVGATGLRSLRAGLVFSRIVPMHFSDLAARHDVLIKTVDNLDHI